MINRFLGMIILVIILSFCNRDKKSTGLINKENRLKPIDSSKYFQKRYFMSEYKSGNLYCYTNFEGLKENEWDIAQNVLFEKFNLIRSSYTAKINGYEKQLSDSVIFERFGTNFYKQLDSMVKLEEGNGLSKWQINKHLYIFAIPMPEFKYKKDSFDKYIDNSILKYQTRLNLKSQNRDVILVGDISKKGQLTNLRLYKKVDSISDSLSLLIIKRLKNDWKPGKVDNKPVNVRNYFYLRW